MQLKTDGLIIREMDVGEDDRILTLLTRDRGVIHASARGGRRIKGRLGTSCRLLAYSRFTLFKGRDRYIIDDAETVESFFGLRGDIEKLALAQYFCELSLALAPAEEPAEMYLRLILNAVYMLQSGRLRAGLCKAAFEIRILTMSGYMPDIVACRKCSGYEPESGMFFYPGEGFLCCGTCGGGQPGDGSLPLSAGALAAMRHIAYAPFEKLFSFTLPGQAEAELCAASEEFMHCRLERTFPTLEFYKSLAPPDGEALT